MPLVTLSLYKNLYIDHEITGQISKCTVGTFQ